MSKTPPKKRQPRGSVSSYFALGRKQVQLDFVDVNVWGDTPLFVNPGALRTSNSAFAKESVYLLRTFMECVLEAVRKGGMDEAWPFLSYLSEPNETHLGLSKQKAAGHGAGAEIAKAIADALMESSAGRTGLIEDLEDSALLIPGIGSDIISDITTNIIRGPLLQYTAEICAYYKIPTKEVAGNAIWDPEELTWRMVPAQLPVANGPLILVPKFIVRKRNDSSSYMADYLFDFIAERELENPNSEFVRTIKTGKRKGERVVLRVALRERYRDKSAIEYAIVNDQALYEKYRAAKAKGAPSLISGDSLEEALHEKPTDLDELWKSVAVLDPGIDHAYAFQAAIERLLSALFSNVLRFPKLETHLNDARKRIDITWTNDASGGFFSWLAKAYAAQNVMAECKNYSGEVGNPDFDQLAGRFGPTHGKFGLLICRAIANKELAYARCKDLARGKGEYIIPMDDEDLKQLVAAKKLGQDEVFKFLKSLFDKITF